MEHYKEVQQLAFECDQLVKLLDKLKTIKYQHGKLIVNNYDGHGGGTFGTIISILGDDKFEDCLKVFRDELFVALSEVGMNKQTELNQYQIVKSEPLIPRKKSRCCGRCDGVYDICISDDDCDEHNVRGCEVCWPHPSNENIKPIKPTAPPSQLIRDGVKPRPHQSNINLNDCNS